MIQWKSADEVHNEPCTKVMNCYPHTAQLVTVLVRAGPKTGPEIEKDVEDAENVGHGEEDVG